MLSPRAASSSPCSSSHNPISWVEAGQKSEIWRWSSGPWRSIVEPWVDPGSGAKNLGRVFKRFYRDWGRFIWWFGDLPDGPQAGEIEVWGTGFLFSGPGTLDGRKHLVGLSFESGSLYVAQASLELAIFPSLVLNLRSSCPCFPSAGIISSTLHFKEPHLGCLGCNSN
jgi:hypothetical protein